MWQFFKYFFASILGTIVGFFVFALLGIFIMAASSSSSSDVVKIDENTILKLDLNQIIEENAPNDDSNPFKGLGNYSPFGSEPDKVGIVQVKDALKRAAADSKIKGIYLVANYPMVGYAQAEEIRNALINFKKSGKFIYSYGEVFSEKGYYLSSISDKIYLNPAGGMDFNGLSIEYTFFKGALDKLDIKPFIFKVGDFKSAVEPFIRDNMSDASRAQTVALTNSINDHVMNQIALSRNLQVSDIKKVADELGAYKPEGALKSKLITNVGYYDEFEAEMKKSVKIKATDKLEFVGLSKYLDAESVLPFNDSENRVAVLVASGEIVSGKNSDGQIASEDFIKDLKKLREDKKVKAIVLRIDSPGGSALASDIMWREIQLTRAVKPVIASMGDYAASGGYYMAMGTDAIVAQPTTITGSIGIFGMLFNAEGFLKNKAGITHDAVQTNAHSTFPSVTHEMSDFEKDFLQRSVEKGYETFTSKAAQGRKMKLDQLKSIASGRVWSGIEAKANGLVDALGGVDDAVKLAAQKANLKDADYRVKFYPAPKDFFTKFLDKKSEETEAKILEAQFGTMAPYVMKFKKLQSQQGIMAKMPFDMEIK